MRQAIETEPRTRFFLATDAPEEERRLRDLFPGRVMSYAPPAKVYDRNRSRALCDAVVDLYCLSKTRELLASFDSSFSSTAAELGRIRPQVVTRQ